MPRFQPKVVGFVALLLILTIYYITNGARSTYESEFYQRTVSVLEKTKDATSRQIVAEDERQRAERVERLRIEHDAATAAAATPPEGKDDTRVKAAPKQQPLQDRKKSGGKVVDDKLSTDSDDGVAKVGNVRGGNSLSEKEESESNEEHDVEVYLNEILKKGPIIVFSKSYCPYSKKAKHILLDLYTITPPPYVVELDLEPLGQGLQNALLKSTGRRTVPNILINGKSIGGGDDIQALHESGRLVDKVQAMGGRRIMEIFEKAGDKIGVKFKA